MRILIVDDEPVVTDDLSLYLERKAHQVEVLNYVQGKEHLQRVVDRFNPEGVILDYDMVPRGFTLYAWIRERRVSVSIVFYTKYAEAPWHRAKMLEVGAMGEHIVEKSEIGNDLSPLLRALALRDQ